MWAGSLPELTFQRAEFPEIKATPEISATGARFTQTTGGRTGAPFPRPVSGNQINPGVVFGVRLAPWAP